MATMYVESCTEKTKLSTIIEDGIRNLNLEEPAENLQRHIRDQIDNKADGMTLWAELMFVVLSKQKNEDDIRDLLTSTLNGQEVQELNLILAWLTCATRPLNLSELQAVLLWSSKTGSRALALAHRLGEELTFLFELIRDDGLSTRSLRREKLQSRRQATLGRFNFIPEATLVTFAHETIGEYFRRGRGKASIRKNLQAIGVDAFEAQCTILRTCLGIFVNPGMNEKLHAAQTLRSYAVDSWPYHLHEALSRSEGKLPIEGTDILRALYRFLSDDRILSSWCCDATWPTFSLDTAIDISRWAERTEGIEKSCPEDGIEGWIQLCKKKPVEVFLPAAEVYAIEGLHKDDWIPVNAVENLAQIRALVTNEATLDRCTQPLSLSVIFDAVKWAGLEETPTWHRKLAVCLRNCGHINEAMDNFEIALAQDPSLVLARSGLAILYQRKAHREQAIELELVNASTLSEQYQVSKDKGSKLLKDLCESYEFIARNFQALDDSGNALYFWRKAFDTGEINNVWLCRYLHLLAISPKDDRWTDIIYLLKETEKRQGPDNANYLTHCILKNPESGDCVAPKGYVPNFFAIIATAAKHTMSTKWLEDAYEGAIRASKSHVTAILLKCCLIRLLKYFANQWSKAEPLIEEIADIAILAANSRIEKLDLCKLDIAQDFGLICVRKSLDGRLSPHRVGHYHRKLSKFYNSGVETLHSNYRAIFEENARVHLVLMQRLVDADEDAMDTARPYVSARLSSAAATGSMALVIILLALDRDEDAIAISASHASRASTIGTSAPHIGMLVSPDSSLEAASRGDNQPAPRSVQQGDYQSPPQGFYQSPPQGFYQSSPQGYYQSPSQGHYQSPSQGQYQWPSQGPSQSPSVGYSPTSPVNYQPTSGMGYSLAPSGDHQVFQGYSGPAAHHSFTLQNVPQPGQWQETRADNANPYPTQQAAGTPGFELPTGWKKVPGTDGGQGYYEGPDGTKSQSYPSPEMVTMVAQTIRATRHDARRKGKYTCAYCNLVRESVNMHKNPFAH
ncbi:hypothetical protein K491DRAFT_781634 [Lophiostoma macrostomum CBS 122681]|uniref:TPR-like protein n=1 Tax=Lophiostoma macrostomum CBS 122681 TaxID=1314788 RepID=A0A6A6SVY7_9PLEO|nr:hypothetical protein K491DRAFT_781634 [Lophiostoma macrostomum CBS 122681]